MNPVSAMLGDDRVEVKLHRGPRPEEDDLSLDLGDLEWFDGDGLGPEGLSASGRDLLEIARVVWEVERKQPKRISSRRLRRVEVAMALRRPEVWSMEATRCLSRILRMLGNAEWVFEFRARSSETALDRRAEAAWREDNPVPAVSLFSGGLDSTSGLAWLQSCLVHAARVSFYGPKAKQRKIAQEFASAPHFQIKCTWKTGERHFGGQFQYRTILFLAIGGAVAQSFGASAIYQFENGPLALAMPPTPIYRMTRHAHPALQAEVEALFGHLFGHPIAIENPFLLKTKREITTSMRSVLDGAALRSVLSSTETCWNLTSRRVLAAVEKPPGMPCGVCIPCIVRRAALPEDPLEHAINLSSRKVRATADPSAKLHLEAFLSWARKMSAADYELAEFTLGAPYVLREAISTGRGGLTYETAFDLYRRFARELLETFT